MKVEVYEKCLLEILWNHILSNIYKFWYIQVFVDLYTIKFIPVFSPQLLLSNYLRIFTLYDDITTIYLYFKNNFYKQIINVINVLMILHGNYICNFYYIYLYFYYNNFYFRLKLTTTLIQKLGTFFMWNEKQKDGGMDQNTLHCCYGEYLTTN